MKEDDCKPTQDPATGQWECPRGKDAPWESLEDACARCEGGEGRVKLKLTDLGALSPTGEEWSEA